MKVKWGPSLAALGVLATIVGTGFAGLSYYSGKSPVAMFRAGEGGLGVATNKSKAHGGNGGAACDRGDGGRGGDAYADSSSEAWGGEGGEGACSYRAARGGRAHIPDAWANVILPDGRRLADAGFGNGGDGGFVPKQ